VGSRRKAPDRLLAQAAKLRLQTFQSSNALRDIHPERKSTDRAGENAEDRGRGRRFLIAIAKAA
jgi:hypothetical protein